MLMTTRDRNLKPPSWIWCSLGWRCWVTAVERWEGQTCPHPTQIHLESKKRTWQLGSFNITFPFQLVAISDELQGVRFIWRIDVVHVNVQVVRRVQEVVRQQRAFAVVQRKVHLGRDERSAFAARRGNAAIAPRWAQVQGVGWSCSKGIAKHAVLEWGGGWHSVLYSSSVLPTGSVIGQTTGGVHVSVLWK